MIGTRLHTRMMAEILFYIKVHLTLFWLTRLFEINYNFLVIVNLFNHYLFFVDNPHDKERMS